MLSKSGDMEDMVRPQLSRQSRVTLLKKVISSTGVNAAIGGGGCQRGNGAGLGVRRGCWSCGI
jgi:hypothetical protein